MVIVHQLIKYKMLTINILFIKSGRQKQNRQIHFDPIYRNLISKFFFIAFFTRYRIVSITEERKKIEISK